MLKIAEDRRRGEKELRESELRFQQFAELAPVGIVISDREENIVYASPKFFDLFGYSLEEVPSVEEWWQLAYPDEAMRESAKHQWAAAMEGARKRRTEIRPVEYPVTCKDGSVRQIEFRLSTAEALNFVICTDVTERKKAEAERGKLQDQLLQAQKMESVGRLAGGVAHDYNNMLGVILGYTEMALERVDPEDPLHEDLSEILAAARRSSDITRQLLAFARKQTSDPKVLDLNETVEGMLKMLRRLIGEHINLSWQPGGGLWPVRMDPSQLDQILANLCVNAGDAIAEVGNITIETENVAIDEEYCAEHPGSVLGEFVVLAISDDGTGMDKEILENLFEPFFTTKKSGEGTGLGLATVYGIVKQNEGFINVYSEPGKGTTFRIYLPRHTGDTEEETKPIVPEVAAGRGEIILLVEDERSILRIGKKMLESLGYSVLAASSAEEAAALAKEHAGMIHLLITDVVMPAMNGRELAERLQALYPDLKVLFMSGYTANVIAHRGVLEASMDFIQKPFSKRDLAEKVRKVLEE
ncbi:MAG: response regulator [Desulfobacterales bacterium]|nr:response regulator [Desulfobacterales bacterium]